MDVKLIFFLGFIALVVSKDIGDGLTSTIEEKIYDEKKEAGPAIWVQDNNVTVSANDTEVISRVTVTDLRPEKDGEAKIVEGGVGKNNVTIELKSPAVFRGFDFRIEVYAMPMEEYIKNHDKTEYSSNKDDKQEVINNPKQEEATNFKESEVSSVKMQPAQLSTDIKVDKRETTEQSQSTTPKVSTTTKNLNYPSFIGKDGEDHDDKQPILPLVMPTLKPAAASKDDAKSEDKKVPLSSENVNFDTKTTESSTQTPRKYRDTDGVRKPVRIMPKNNSAKDSAEIKRNAPVDTDPIHESSTSFSDSPPIEISPNNGFSIAKNINDDTKSTESVISSKTTQAPRRYRDTGAVRKPVRMIAKMDSAKDSAEVKTNAPTDSQTQEKAEPIHESSTPLSDSPPIEISPNNEFTTVKNVNVNTKSTESVISSKTTPAFRNSRDTYGNDKLTTSTLKTDSTRDRLEVTTNAPDMKVQDMKPYPMQMIVKN